MAGGCPLLLSYTTPGEHLRGCSFAEGFKSYSDLVLNSESITGSPTVADGACTFDGASNVIYKKQVFPRGVSFQVSFKTSSLQAAKGIVSNWDVAIADGVVFETNIGGTIGLYIYDNTTNPITARTVTVGTGPTFYADNNWHTILFSVDRINNKFSLVVDGVIVDNQTAIAANVKPCGTSTRLKIGSTYDAGSYFTGQIRDVKIWDQALDVDEAQAYYNGTMFGFEKRIKVYYPMRAQDHDVANSRTLDVSGNGYHGVQSVSVPTKMSTRGYTYAINQQHLSPVISASDQARTLFWAFKGMPNPAAADYGPSIVSNPVGFTGIIAARRTSSGVIQILHNNAATATTMFTNASCLPFGMLFFALSAPSGGSCSGQAMLNFQSVNLTGILRNGNDSRLSTSMLAGLDTGVAGDCLSVGLWHEQLNKTQMAEFQARFLKQVNDV